MKQRYALIAGLMASGLVLGPAVSATAAGSINAGTRTCTGSSSVYTRALAAGAHHHTHYGPDFRQRDFAGNPFVAKTTYYYSGGKGTYTGQVIADWLGDIHSASIGCDY